MYVNIVNIIIVRMADKIDEYCGSKLPVENYLFKLKLNCRPRFFLIIENKHIVPIYLLMLDEFS